MPDRERRETPNAAGQRLKRLMNSADHSSNRTRSCVLTGGLIGLRTLIKGAYYGHDTRIPPKELKHADTTVGRKASCMNVWGRGLLVAETARTLGRGGNWHETVFQCGALVDRVILQNRQRRPTAGLSTSPRSSVVLRSEHRI